MMLPCHEVLQVAKVVVFVGFGLVNDSLMRLIGAWLVYLGLMMVNMSGAWHRQYSMQIAEQCGQQYWQ